MIDNFEEKAKTFDSNPIAIEISSKFSNEVKKNINLKKDYRLLDFGCGTGLVSLPFSSLVNSIVMVDNSKAMLNKLREKVLYAKLTNIEIYEGNIEDLDIEQSSIDLIVSSMTFHHIDNIPKILKILYDLLKENGCIIIGDLCREDGSFHELTTVEHNGFGFEEIMEMFVGSNFFVKDIYKYNTVSKSDKEGIIKNYDQFILVVNKTTGNNIYN
jgi:ubiquinone/menaquinone biosynthesis C-methylase UbiE